jgi:hypothetical protein
MILRIVFCIVVALKFFPGIACAEKMNNYQITQKIKELSDLAVKATDNGDIDKAKSLCSDANRLCYMFFSFLRVGQTNFHYALK